MLTADFAVDRLPPLDRTFCDSGRQHFLRVATTNRAGRPQLEDEKMSNDYNSSTNSRILSELVRREVLHCVSATVSHLISLGEEFDDAETLYELTSRPQYTHEFEYECECGHDWSVMNEEPEDLIELADVGEGEQQCNCPSCGALVSPSDVSAYEADPIEALEFWAVSSYFAEKLAEQGEMVAEVLDFHVWGRTTSGQQIAADDVVGRIAEGMEILDGQVYSWADRV
jgi:hypothetical protein